MSNQELRPLERVILRLQGDNVPIPEIARRVGKRPGTVDRIIRMIDFKKDRSSRPPSTRQVLRPLERVILRLLGEGESYGEIGNRLGRSGAQVRRIEAYAKLKTS